MGNENIRSSFIYCIIIYVELYYIYLLTKCVSTNKVAY